MSEPVPKRNWLSGLLNRSTVASTRSESVASKTFTASQFLNCTTTNPMDILKPLQSYRDSTANPYKALPSKFVPIQRLNSVGGVEPDQTRYSYPPTSRSIDSCLMENRLQSMLSEEVVSEDQHITFHSSLSSSATTSKNSISFINSYLASSFSKISGSISNSIASISEQTWLPQAYKASLLETEKRHSISNNSMNKLHPRKTDIVGSKPSMCVVSCSCPNNACSNGINSVPNHSLELLSSIQTALPDADSKILNKTVGKCTFSCDSPNSEITLMSQECFEEVQKRSSVQSQLQAKDSALSTESTDVAAKDANNIEDLLSSSTVECDSSTYDSKKCNNNTVCKNPIIAHILGYTSNCDSDVDNVSEISTQGESDADDVSEYSCSFADSEESCCESDEEDVSSHAEEDDINIVHTDTDDDCVWERIVSCRAPWTCNQRRKRTLQQRTFNVTPECDTNSLESSEDEINHEKYSNTFRSIASNFMSSSTSECSFVTNCKEIEFDSNVSNDLFDTVKRPNCSNSEISSILGWSHDDSDSDEDSVVFEDVIDNGSNSLNTSSEKDISKASDRLETTSQLQTSCMLWDYFIKYHNPITNIPLPSFPSNEETSIVAETHVVINVNTDNTPKQCNLSYKTPSKVRFCDKVEVHPIVAWAFAYREARKGNWDRCARDRSRFMMRIAKVDKEISWCLQPVHRAKVLENRSTQLC